MTEVVVTTASTTTSESAPQPTDHKLVATWRDALQQLALASDEERAAVESWLGKRHALCTEARVSVLLHTYELDVRLATVDHHVLFLARHGFRHANTKTTKARLEAIRLTDCTSPMQLGARLPAKRTQRLRNVYVQYSDLVRWATPTGVAEWPHDDWSAGPPKQRERRALVVRHLQTGAPAPQRPASHVGWNGPLWTTTDGKQWFPTPSTLGDEKHVVVGDKQPELPEWVRAAPAFRLLQKRCRWTAKPAVGAPEPPLEPRKVRNAVYLLLVQDPCAPDMFRTQAYAGLAKAGVGRRWNEVNNSKSHAYGIAAVLGARPEDLPRVTTSVQLVDCVLAASLRAGHTPYLFLVGGFHDADAMCAEELYWRTTPELSLRDARFGLNVL